VYRATDTALGREVAVKVLLKRFTPGSGTAGRFREEARIAAQLQHPGIPPVHDLGTLPDGRPFLAMKLIRGETLDALLAARAPGRAGGPPAGSPEPPPVAAADLPRFVAVFGQICQAVGYAHQHGVIHRDLKPSNVMVGSFGEVQVMDWGLAKVLAGGAADVAGEVSSGRDGPAHTRVGSVLGTPAYMPPEQAQGRLAAVDRRSDVFGLGGILCQILTGLPPYTGPHRDAVLALAWDARLDDARARLAACGADPELVALAERCLAADPIDRPADAGAVAAAVAAHLTGVQEKAQQERVDRERRRAWAAARRRRRLVVAAVATLAAAVVIAPHAREAYAQRQLRQWAGWAAAYHPAYEITSAYRVSDGRCQLAVTRTSASPGDPAPDQVVTAVFHRAEHDGLLDRVAALDLTGLGLTHVPPEVFCLPRLAALHLGGNQLTELPADVARLADLTTLVLAQNLLETLPPELERLDKLAALDVADNALKTVPPVVFRIPSLTSLSLKRNEQMAEYDLPADVAGLPNLTTLDLGRTNLKRLPAEVGRLTKLTRLHAPRNNLTELPAEIGQLRNLIALHLSNNPLTGLPPQIGSLQNLAELYVSDCGLGELPAEVGRLANLTTLHASGNQLLAVPPEIAGLQKLRTLDLRTNGRGEQKFLALPPDLANVFHARRTAVHLGTGPAAGGHVHGLRRGKK
jgi:hypothetical protein